MRYEFDKVAILCTTDEQVRHLATMVTTHKLQDISMGKYFRKAIDVNSYSNFNTPKGNPIVTYEEFIAGMQETETQVVEVTGCADCIFLDLIADEWHFCNHPDHVNNAIDPTKEMLFTTCPLKKGAVTIKLK